MTSKTRLPILTLLLLVANLFAAFAVLLDPLLVDQYGFLASNPKPFHILTALFLHQNVFHLLGNMVFLAAVGASVELATGWYRFLVVYFGSGICGTLLHWAMTRHVFGEPPLIGASGALAGCASYYAARYTRLKVPVGPNLSASILVVAIAWLVLQVLGAVIKLGDASSAVSYWAHLGGFATGVLLSFVFRGPDILQEKLDQQVLDNMRERGPAAEAAAARRHLEKQPRDRETLKRLADALDVLGEHDELADVLMRMLDVSPVAEQKQLLNRLFDTKGDSKLASSRRLAMARDYLPTDGGLAFRLLSSVAESGDDPDRAEAMFAIAEILQPANPDGSKAMSQRLVDTFPNHPAATRVRARGML